MGIIIKDKNIAIVCQGMSDTRNLERENSDIKMPTVENQETQMIMFLTKRGGATILQIEEQTKSQYSNSPRSKNTNQSKPISKNTEKILNITPLSKKKKHKGRPVSQKREK